MEYMRKCTMLGIALLLCMLTSLANIAVLPTGTSAHANPARSESAHTRSVYARSTSFGFGLSSNKSNLSSHKNGSLSDEHWPPHHRHKRSHYEKIVVIIIIPEPPRPPRPPRPSGVSTAFSTVSSLITTLSTGNTPTEPSTAVVGGLTGLPMGNYLINATIPVRYNTSNGQLTCSFNVTNGTGIAGTQTAVTTSTNAPVPGGDGFGVTSMPLTDSVTITAADPAGATLDVVCSITATADNANTQTATVSLVSVSADKKQNLTEE